jgi:hypothetical protein
LLPKEKIARHEEECIDIEGVDKLVYFSYPGTIIYLAMDKEHTNNTKRLQGVNPSD